MPNKPAVPLRAYEDIEFLNRGELRAVRMQTELLKPELVLADANVHSTVGVFGSARTLSPDEAQARLEEARITSAKLPPEERQSAIAAAEMGVKNSRYYAIARELGARISRLGQSQGVLEYVVITGGGPGIMEAANRGAKDVNAKSVGLNITLPFEQSANPYITPELNFMFHYFSIRKMHFLMRAKGLCVFPGGYGTMDELFETLTLIQTKKINPLPIILFGIDFWEDLLDWDVFVRWGMICKGDLELFTYADDAGEAVDIILDFYQKHPDLRRNHPVPEYRSKK